MYKHTRVLVISECVCGCECANDRPGDLVSSPLGPWEPRPPLPAALADGQPVTTDRNP